jgi:glycosyltransferase involved in cell wall biosynthesis
MQILMTSDTFLPRLGGAEYHVSYLRRELRRMGHGVVLMTTERGQTDDEEGIIRWPYSGVRFLLYLFFAVWRASRGVDLIHSHFSYRLAFLAGTVARLRRVPFVITQHGLGLLPQAGATKVQNIVFRFWRFWSMRMAHRIISTSEDLSREIRTLGFGHKIVSIPNGYDPERFFPLPSPPPPLVILTVRRLVPKTGVQYLISALPALLERYPHLRCVIVGGGRLKEQLMALTENFKVSDAVEFAGDVPHERLIDFYRQAHVVVFPSTAESTSLACIEAMACGRVIVASRVGGLIELLGRNEERGYLVSITDTEHSSYDAPPTLSQDRIRHLADAILRALEAEEEAQGKAQKASNYVQSRFSWRLLVQQTVCEVYDPLL